MEDSKKIFFMILNFVNAVIIPNRGTCFKGF